MFPFQKPKVEPRPFWNKLAKWYYNTSLLAQCCPHVGRHGTAASVTWRKLNLIQPPVMLHSLFLGKKKHKAKMLEDFFCFCLQLKRWIPVWRPFRLWLSSASCSSACSSSSCWFYGRNTCKWPGNRSPRQPPPWICFPTGSQSLEEL